MTEPVAPGSIPTADVLPWAAEVTGLAADLAVPERLALGRSRREVVPRTSWATWEPSSDRDPVATLVADDQGRLPDLVPLRHERMLVSPFALYRASARQMAIDLAPRPITGIAVTACGDAHASNFGVFATAERRLVFDLNDFDEAHPGPWEWDLVRLATSIELVGLESHLADRDRRLAVRRTVASYRDRMAEFAEQRAIDVWYASIEPDAAAAALDRRAQRAVDAVLTQARRRDHRRAIRRLTEPSPTGGLQFQDRPPELVRLPRAEGAADAVLSIWDAYLATMAPDSRALLRRYRLVDLARKVVGVGSVGTRCFVALLAGPGLDPSDALVLQFKEAGASALADAWGPAGYPSEGERVVTGQRLLQSAGDPLLGWMQVTDPFGTTRSFYGRQLWDAKGSAALVDVQPEGLARYGELCGWALARAHARSGDPALIAGYLGGGRPLGRALADFAARYGEQVISDHARVVDALGPAAR